jgi:hypothetical protein
MADMRSGILRADRTSMVLTLISLLMVGLLVLATTLG